MKKRFKVVTLGCRTNQYESQAYRDQLLRSGYVEAVGEEVADLCIVNTCTVTAGADRSSRHEIRSLRKGHPDAKLVVTGCFAERAPEEVLTVDPEAQVISNKDKEKLLSLAYPEQEFPEFAIEHFQAHTRAFVKVQDGCNSFCTYCIIPYVRGRSRSRGVEEVVREVEQLIQNGYQEVVLTGINIGDFDAGGTLADLVRAVDALEGLKRLRISSIDPDEVDGNLLSSVLEGKTTSPSMHIVLQSGSNVVLKRMNRKYTTQIFLETVERIRQERPDFTFTTDVIVGFPGETEQDFAETLAVMQEVQFAKVHLFPYSERARTRAALYPNKVPPQVIQERMQRALRVAEQTAFSLRERYVGGVSEVLVEKDLFGHTDHFLPVLIQPSPKISANRIVRVHLKENSPLGLIGEVV